MIGRYDKAPFNSGHTPYTFHSVGQKRCRGHRRTGRKHCQESLRRGDDDLQAGHRHRPLPDIEVSRYIYIRR